MKHATVEDADISDLYFEFEERAAIIAEGCDISQEEATERAAREYGFSCASEFYEIIGRKPDPLKPLFQYGSGATATS